ncbi:hypothetical protein SAMN05660831_00461 [Thiohalospira halophila DSM 15071]|uniref:Alpha/beta hydrolase family protein n=1 Tax=Thiohalospira halophila DSM 15071 TaxID=1123397 RepID=A0A1I1NWJ4_9GAMM|nr:alpha/beta hydrolase [Thiohalospira halophila]SFD01702.1 hypothetical protein SAMN05660831_00461 [Thiohalospira halophila DSM 15071]
MRRGGLLLILVLGLATASAEPVERSFNGATLKADYTAPAQPGRGVVLLYPDASHPKVALWQSLQEAILRGGFGVLVVQPRGAGASCNGPWRRLHRAGMEEVGSWFDWLLRRGITRVHFLGEGRGGNQVAWFLARSRHPALGAALLLDPLVWRADRAAARYRREHGQSLEPLLERARELRNQGRADELLRGIGFLHCESVDVTAAAMLSYYADEPNLDTSRLLADLPGPAAVLVDPEHEGYGRLERAAGESGDEFHTLSADPVAGAAGAVVGFLGERGEDGGSE